MSEGERECVSDFNCCGLKTGEAGSTGLTGRLDRSNWSGPMQIQALVIFVPIFANSNFYYLGTETKKI